MASVPADPRSVLPQPVVRGYPWMRTTPDAGGRWLVEITWTPQRYTADGAWRWTATAVAVRSANGWQIDSRDVIQAPVHAAIHATDPNLVPLEVTTSTPLSVLMDALSVRIYHLLMQNAITTVELLAVTDLETLRETVPRLGPPSIDRIRNALRAYWDNTAIDVPVAAAEQRIPARGRGRQRRMNADP